MSPSRVRRNAVKWRLDVGQIEVLDDAIADILRDKTPAERVEMISAAHRTARQLLAGGIRHQHPNWTDEEVTAEVSKRLLGITEEEWRSINEAAAKTPAND